MSLTGAATALGIPNFGGTDRPALHLSPGLLDITAAIDALMGHVYSRATFSATVNCQTGTSLSPVVVVTSAAVTLDGATPIMVEFGCPYLSIASGINLALSVWDKLGAAAAVDLGIINLSGPAQPSGLNGAAFCSFGPLTPAAGSHLFSIRGWIASGAGIAGPAAGSGGVGTNVPGYVVVRRATT